MTIILFAAIAAIFIALLFDFTNGFNDSANQVAAVIASNALSPYKALAVAAIGDFVGAFFLGTAVAETLGSGIVDPRLMRIGISGVEVIFAALIGAITWNIITWYFGLPSSSSHALIGGILGAFITAWGISPINWTKVSEIIAVMLISPIIGFTASYSFTRMTLLFARFATPKANNKFRKLQILSLIGQSLSHGTNDAQKTMGIITFILIILGLYNLPPSSSIMIPKWVILASSAAIASGTLVGGWRIIKTLGIGLYKIRPIQAFSSQVVSALTIYISALFGFPISTTQVISSSIIGAGAATRKNMVRWLAAGDIVAAWLITIPASAIFAALTYFIIRYII